MSLIPRLFGTGRRSNVFDPFSLDIWDPFQDLPLRSGTSGFDAETAAVANTRIDWKETPEAHVFKADLPGLKKEEVKVEVEEGRVLQISGERTKEKEEKNDKWHRVERSGGRFLRRFRLPENAKVDQVKASLENGVLTVTLPKEEVKNIVTWFSILWWNREPVREYRFVVLLRTGTHQFANWFSQTQDPDF